MSEHPNYISTALRLLGESISPTNQKIDIPAFYDIIAIAVFASCVLKGSYEISREHYLYNSSISKKTNLAELTGCMILGGFGGGLIGLLVGIYWPISLPAFIYYKITKNIEFD